jgi:hypothetical protein
LISPIETVSRIALDLELTPAWWGQVRARPRPRPRIGIRIRAGAGARAGVRAGARARPRLLEDLGRVVDDALDAHGVLEAGHHHADAHGAERRRLEQLAPPALLVVLRACGAVRGGVRRCGVRLRCAAVRCAAVRG